MIKLTTLKFIKLQWVHSLMPDVCILILYIFLAVLHPCHKLHYFKKVGWEETVEIMAQLDLNKRFQLQ